MSERKYWSGGNLTKLEKNKIFVFGSNPRGAHSYGGALAAFEHFGAIKGQSRGLMGQSYGLVTKNLKWDAGYTEKSTGITYENADYRSVSPEQISDNVIELYECAKQNPDKEFLITYKNEKWGGGKPKKSLNGYYPLEMLGFLMDNKDIPDNIVFHDSFKEAVDLKLRGMSNAGIQKRSGMKALKTAFETAKENGTVRTATITPHDGTKVVKDAYTSILESKREKKITPFFTPYDVFSQWHPSKFEYKGFNFTSAEQFMMFSKAKLFKDESVASALMDMNEIELNKDFIAGKLTPEILLSNKSSNEYIGDPILVSIIGKQKLTKADTMAKLWSAVQAKVKAYGKLVCKNDGIPWDEKLWLENREKIVSSGSRLKYSQNEGMKTKLLDTKGTLIVEASPWDKLSTKQLLIQNLIKLKKDFQNNEVLS